MAEVVGSTVDKVKLMRQKWEEEKRLAQKPYAEMLCAGLNLSENDAYALLKTVISYEEKTPFDGLTEQEVCDLVQYYLDLFGGVEPLCDFLEAQEAIDNGPYVPYFRKKTLFYLSPKEKVGKLFHEICAYLNTSKENCVIFLISKPGCLFRPFSYFEQHFESLKEFWGLSHDEASEFIIRYPKAFGKKVDYLENRIQRINEHFHVDENKIKKLILTYPRLLERSPSFFKNNNVPEIVFEKPWILECITEHTDTNCGGYRTWENFFKYVDIVEQHFGKIERVEDVRLGENRLVGFITNLDGVTYYVSVGAGLITPQQLKDPLSALTDEEKLLRAIFGEKVFAGLTYQQELISHYEVYAQIDGSPESILFLTGLRNLFESKQTKYGGKFKPESQFFEKCQKGYILDIEHPDALDIPYDEDKNLSVSFKRVCARTDGTFMLMPHFKKGKTE